MQSIKLTVALPTYRSRNILWLALEGLCRQKTSYLWELVVCEEPSQEFAGVEFLNENGYTDRLREAGCVSINYLKLNRFAPLSLKWKYIADRCDGKYFMLTASDNFSPPDRIERSVQAMESGDHDWYGVRDGLFLNLDSGDTATFRSPPGTPGLFMCTLSERVRKLKKPYPLSGIDSWIRTTGKIVNPFQEEEPLLGLHTDGSNRISTNRHLLYSGGRYHAPFISPEQKLPDILPEAIMDRLLGVTAVGRQS